MGQGCDLPSVSPDLLSSRIRLHMLHSLGPHFHTLQCIDIQNISTSSSPYPWIPSNPLTHSYFHAKQTTHRPASWIMSLTTPLMYPFFSAKSMFLNLAGDLLWWVWDLKIPPDFLCARMTRYHQSFCSMFLSVSKAMDGDLICISCEGMELDVHPYWQVLLKAKEEGR